MPKNIIITLLIVFGKRDVIKIVESGKALKIVELGGLMFGEFEQLYI